MSVTRSHRLVLPADANHHGTLYAGVLLRFALEAGYASAYRHVGEGANLVLRRVLNLECYHPVPIGAVIEVQGLALHSTQAYLVVGLVGAPLSGRSTPWMDGLMGFVQVDENGKPTPFPTTIEVELSPAEDHWRRLREKLGKLLSIR